VVIEEFMPRELDEAGVQSLVQQALQELAATAGHALTPKDMGAAMKAVQARLQAGGARADGRQVSDLVKKSLAG
jgi:hypothetical protein